MQIPSHPTGSAPEASTGRDQRRLKRRLTRIHASFESSRVQGAGHVKNVSSAGLFVRTEVLPQRDEPVCVVFRDHLDVGLAVYGTVRWTTGDLPIGTAAKNGFGMLIAEPSDRFRNFYQYLLTGTSGSTEGTGR